MDHKLNGYLHIINKSKTPTIATANQHGTKKPKRKNIHIYKKKTKNFLSCPSISTNGMVFSPEKESKRSSLMS